MITIPRNTALSLGVVLGLAAFITPILALVGIIVIGVGILSRYKTFSTLEAAALTLLLLFASLSALYSIVTIAHVSLPVRLALPLLYLALFFLSVFFSRNKRLTYKPSINRSDVAAFCSSTIVLFILLIPIINQSGGYVAQFLSYGEDNASHYALTRYAFTNGDYSYTKSPDQAGLLESLEIYPQGFHIVSAVLLTTTLPSNLTDAGLVKAYGILLTLFFAMFVFWLSKLCLSTSARLSKLYIAALLPALALLCGLGVLLLLLDRGFQTQIYTYSSLLATLYIMTLAAKRQGPESKLILYICCGLLLLIATSWWVVLPITVALLIAYAYEHRIVKDTLRNTLKYWPVTVIIGFTALYPFIVNLLLTTKSSPLNEQGGVDKLPYTIFAYLVPVIILALIAVRRRFFGRPIRYVLIALGLAVIGVALVGVYQQLSIHQFAYYYYKMLYTVYVLLIVLFFMSGSLILQRFDTIAKHWSYRVLVALLIVGVTVIVSARNNLVHSKVYVHNWFPNVVEVHELDQLFIPDTYRYNDVIYLGDCVASSDYLANRWAGARMGSETILRKKITLSILYEETAKTNRYLALHVPKSAPILLSVDRGCDSKYPILTELAKKPGVTVRYTNVEKE